ncbi:hypothetical protein BH10BAC6_BH10BAC6_17190 [soil metagenome]
MRGITGTVVRLLCMSVVIAASHIDVRAQNTILVGDLHSVDSTFVWDTTVFATRLPSFALGHQWGAADLDKLNTALQMNVTADQFGFLNPTTHIRQLKHLGRGNNDTNYLVWTSPLANLSDSNMAFLGYWWVCAGSPPKMAATRVHGNHAMPIHGRCRSRLDITGPFRP